MTAPPPTSSLRAAALVAAIALGAACAPASRDGTHPPPSRDAPRATDDHAAGRPAPSPGPGAAEHPRSPVELPEETRLANVRMLTDGGENAEAYWSWDGRRLIFQARRGDEACDRIRLMNADGSGDRVVAEVGAHTCAFFLPGDERIVFASTSVGGAECPPRPDHSQGYVWALHPSFEIYSARTDGSDVRRLTEAPGYDAEATIAPNGRIVFTSARDGDLDIYTMASDGSDVRRLTETPGYDGGPFFSPDGLRIAYRARHPTDAGELADYRRLLGQGLVRPGELDIWVMDADGTNKRRVTDLPGAQFAPAFVPDRNALIFSSNHEDPRGRNFDLYLVDLDDGSIERVTWNETFDGFPMFSPDGRHLAFCSNRANARPGETNVFVADWVP